MRIYILIIQKQKTGGYKMIKEKVKKWFNDPKVRKAVNEKVVFTVKKEIEKRKLENKRR